MGGADQLLGVGPVARVVTTTIVGIAFAALGGWIRQRQEHKGAVESGTEAPGPLG